MNDRQLRAAMIVNRVGSDVNANLTKMLRMASEAAKRGAELVLFPEAALTGLINDDDPIHDLPLGQPIPGPATDALAALAHRQGIWLAIGLLERDGERLYDSAVLLTPTGELVRYRRITPGWHGPDADPHVYGHGREPIAAKTPWGTVSFLICGDLFDDHLLERVRAMSPDLLLFPFARSFADGTFDQERWEREERPAYCERVRRVGVTTLMANYLSDDGCFGGAMAVAADGTVLTSLPIGREGILYAKVIQLPRR